MEICWGVETEQQKMYSETINFYSAKFSIQQLKVIGLFIDGRGTVFSQQFFQDFWKEQKLNKSSSYEILLISLLFKIL